MNTRHPAAPISRSRHSLITEWRLTADWPIIIAVLILLAAGLILSLAAGPVAAMRIGYDNPYHFVYRQAVFATLASVILIAASLLDTKWVRRSSALIFLISFILMALIMSIGHEAKGAQRWIRFGGISLQPSELIKPALIVLTGWLLAQRRLFPGVPWAILSFACFTTTLGLLLIQPDVGQAVLLTAAFVITFFVSGLPLRWAAMFIGGGSGTAGLLYLTMPHVRQRINSFINPSAYDTYQIDKGHEAIMHGGLLGTGPGEGTVKASLPDAHTDFIYAVMSEEYGLLAALLIIALLVFIPVRGILRAAELSDPYPRAAATGLFALFGLQAAINIGVNLSLIPPKGMTLPLISSGGSSLIGTALTLGLALALIRRRSNRINLRKDHD